MGLIFALGSFACADEEPSPSRVIIRERIVEIEQLMLRRSRYELESTTPPKLLVIINGVYPRPGWKLLLNRQPVKVGPRGDFVINVLLTEPVQVSDLEAVGPSGEQQREKLRVSVSPWPPGKMHREGSPLWTFRLYGALLSQDFGGTSLAPALSWNPTWSLGRRIRLSGSVGVTLAVSSDGGHFPILDGEAYLGWRIYGGIELEGGGGMQYWAGYGGFLPIWGGSIAYLFARQAGSILIFNRVFAGYSYIPGENSTKIFRLGIGFSFP